MRSLVTSIFLYASESWTLTAELQRRIQTMKMRCHRKILRSHENEVPPQDTTHLIQRPFYQRGSPYQDPAGNRTTRRPDQRKETQTAVAWSYLPFIKSGQNHPARHSERGGGGGSRQRKRWEDNIREWTDLEFAKSQRAVENKKKWRKLVAKSSVVPQRPTRLRDR